MEKVICYAKKQNNAYICINTNIHMYVCLLGVFNANIVLLHFARNQALSNDILKWRALA